MSVQQILELQNEIANLIFDEAPNNWRIFRINKEMVFDGEEMEASSSIVYCYIGELSDYDIDYLPADNFEDKLDEYFEEMNNLCSQQGERWTVCDFIVSNLGEFRVNFSYDLPRRLSGDHSAGKNDLRPLIEPYI